MDYSQYTIGELKKILSSLFNQRDEADLAFEFARENHAIKLMNNLIHEQNDRIKMIDEITEEIERRDDATE